MQGGFRTIDDLGDVAGKRILVRLDLNVPLENGRVSDATRIERSAPTVRELAGKGAVVVVLSHFGRPKGKVAPEMSLRPIAGPLGDAVGRKVHFVATDWNDDALARAVLAAAPGDVLLAENTRFHPGEEKNEPALVARMADSMDAYVNDAFSAAHRAHASTEGVARRLPAVAGRAMQAELEALNAALTAPDRPVMAIVGGAKISTKLDLLGNLSGKVDSIVIGGAMANTFLAAEGREVGRSLVEAEMYDTARDIVKQAAANGCRIVLPRDVVVAREFAANAANRVCGLDEVAADEMILDIGPDSVESLKAALADTRTVVWNGPFGAFEIEPFNRGTDAVALAVADLTRKGALISVAGGGDTVAALNRSGAAAGFTYVSTAGGAFLEWLEGKSLPGVEALRA
ncbi:MAG: phosphoglycerate kinase [Flavobacteriaceae bacterium]